MIPGRGDRLAHYAVEDLVPRRSATEARLHSISRILHVLDLQPPGGLTSAQNARGPDPVIAAGRETECPETVAPVVAGYDEATGAAVRRGIAFELKARDVVPSALRGRCRGGHRAPENGAGTKGLAWRDHLARQAVQAALTLGHRHRIEGGVAIPGDPQIDLADIGCDRLRVAAVAAVARRRTFDRVAFIADVVGHLDLQAGLQHPAHQRRQQAVVTGQLDALAASSGHQLLSPGPHRSVVLGHTRNATPRRHLARRGHRCIRH